MAANQHLGVLDILALVIAAFILVVYLWRCHRTYKQIKPNPAVGRVAEWFYHVGMPTIALTSFYGLLVLLVIDSGH